MPINLDFYTLQSKKSIMTVPWTWMKLSCYYQLFTIFVLLFELGFAMNHIALENNTVSKATGVSNITAFAFFNEEHDNINLNVSWINPAGTPKQSRHISISLYDTNKTYCKAIGHERLISSDRTSIIIGDEILELYPGCSYEVNITGGQDSHQDVPRIIYTLPECVAEICACFYQPSIEPVITVKQISTEVIRIFWEIPEITDKSNITTVYFRVTQSSREVAKLERNMTDECATDRCHVDVIVPEMAPGTLYHVQVWYIISSNCESNRAYLSYHAQVVVESQVVFQVMISMTFVLMFVCSLWLIWKWRCGCLPGRRLTLKGFRTRISVPMVDNNSYFAEAEAIERGAADNFEINPTQLQLGPQIGSGAFGQVFIARLPPHATVAVKMLRESASSEAIEEFLSEIAMLKQIGHHSNVVKLLGCCTLRQPYCIVMEFVPCGDLLSYLQDLRTCYERKAKNQDKEMTPDNALNKYSIPFDKLASDKETEYTALECLLDSRVLQNFAVQIARGMRHLECKQIVHRDLAARNVLIDKKHTLKISDFGLSRNGIYVNSKHKKVPLRWLSVEAIRDHLYTSKSDVWAYGIVLWEIGTLGGFPYPTLDNSEILDYLMSGKRLEKPENCTAELYALMLKCWSSADDARPSFTELPAYLEVISSKRRVYVDFSQLNPAYMFPPTAKVSTSDSEKGAPDKKM